MTSFFVPGLPIPKGRARTATRKMKGGRSFIAHITPPKTVAYENQVRSAAKEAFTSPLEGPLELRAVFYFPPPESWSRPAKVRAYGQYKANCVDLDNLVKAIADGMNRRPIKSGRETVGWDLVAWTDDSQLCRILVAKKYIATPASPVGVSITVTTI